jgi:hypothetical protein
MMPIPVVVGQKLSPARFTAMSNKMAAIVGFILGEAAAWTTTPAITELIVTGDGFVLASDTDGVGANTMIGDVSDLRRNLVAMAEAAGLTRAERSWLNVQLADKITDFRRGQTAVQVPL